MDDVNRVVTIQVEYPELAHNAAIMDEIFEPSRGQLDEDYFAPVPESFLHKRGRTDREDGE